MIIDMCLFDTLKQTLTQDKLDSFLVVYGKCYFINFSQPGVEIFSPLMKFTHIWLAPSRKSILFERRTAQCTRCLVRSKTKIKQKNPQMNELCPPPSGTLGWNVASISRQGQCLKERLGMLSRSP